MTASLRRFRLLAAVILAARLAAEDPLSVPEAYLLSDDRERFVATLPTGSDDQRYYRCLLWQQEGKLAEVDQLLTQWQELDPAADGGELAQRIRARQALLWYQQDHQRSLALLRHELKMDVEPPSQAGLPGSPQPNALDPVLLSWEAVRARGLDAGGVETGFTQAGMVRLADSIDDPGQIRELLKRLGRPSTPRLVQLMIAELRDPASPGFGALEMHKNLGRAELDACRAAIPALGGNAAFIRSYLAVMCTAHGDGALNHDPGIKRAHLLDLLAFSASLTPRDLSLEAVVRLNLLALDRDAGAVARDDLLAYLRLPGTAAAVDGRRSPTVPAPAGEDLAGITGLPKIEDERGLIEDCLAQVLAKEADDSAFVAEFSEDTRHWMFVDAKLAAGIGDAGQWLTLLKPGQEFKRSHQAELRFLPATSDPLRAGGKAFLEVQLRNVPRAQLRVFALDAAAIYRQSDAEITAAIDLDGVVPNQQRTIEFPAQALRRQRERIELPECGAPGLYVVELVADGKAIRALLRKGQLRQITRSARNGQLLRIYDEDGHRAMQVSAWLDGQEFAADAAGEIRIPYAEREVAKNLVLVQGGVASVASHRLATERYTLDGSMLLDHEQLIAGTTACALVRLHLRLNGEPQPLSALHDATLSVTTLTADLVPQTTTIPLGEVRDGEEAVIRFPVPARAINVSWEAHGLITLQRSADEQRLSAAGRINCNGIDMAVAVANDFLEHAGGGYDVAHLGRNGEAVAGAVLHLELSSDLLKAPIPVTLITDASGRVHLGPLPGIVAIRLADANREPGSQRWRWRLETGEDAQGLPPIAASTDAVVRLPWHHEVAADLVLERIGAPLPAGEAVRHLALEGGQLAITGLPPGTYDLHGLHHWQQLEIVAGVVDGDLVVGAERAFEVGNFGRLAVSAQLEQDGSATIAVTGAGPHPRVHVLGHRFMPTAWPGFAEGWDAQQSWWLPLLPSAFTTALDLGDEYRYISARATAQRLPGIMLERPGLLLNAWRDDKVNATLVGEPGLDRSGGRSGGGMRRALAKGGGMAGQEPLWTIFDNADFLAAPAIVLANLVPDGQGRVRIPPAQFGDARQLVVIACDDHVSTSTIVALPPRALVTRDRTLAKTLDPALHPAFKYRAAVIPAGGRSAIPAGTIDQRIYRDLGDAFRLFSALAPAANLEEFSFLPNWASLADAARATLYGRFASHELDLFLYFKDRPFFDRVVAPYLANKLQKSFLDHWLLGDDLSPWLESSHHDALNACERILLARRLPAAAAADEIRSLGGSGEPTVPERAQWNSWAAIALAAQSHPSAPALAPPPAPAPAPGAREPAGDKAEIQDMPQREFYRAEEQAAILSERAYFGVSDLETGPGLVTMNRFWYEYAHHGEGAFLTPAILAAHGNRSEILLALAVLDLPFPAAAAAPPPLGAGTALVFSSDIEALPVRPGDLMVEQRLCSGGGSNDDLGIAEPVAGDLLPGSAYCTVITVVNPSPRDRQVELLGQIPQGAVAIAESPALLGRSLLIKAFSSTHVVQRFYFPAPGTFAQCPAHLAEGEAVVAVAVAAKELRVQAEAAPTPPWHQRSPADALAYLASADPGTLELSPLLPRLGDKAFFMQVIDALQRRREYDRGVWSYALTHDLPAAITSLLLHEKGFIERIGKAIDSPLLRLDPIADRLVAHFDISPLTNARSHRFAGQAPGGNGFIAGRYAETLDWLCLRADPGSLGWLELAYQLTLQDRIATAQAAFARIDAKGVRAAIQYDYLHAWLALHQADTATARAIALRYAGYAVESWRLRFAEVAAELDEIAGKPAEREAALARQQRQQLLASTAPSLHAELGEGRITITASQLPVCEVRYYPMDLELLFSRAPFAIVGGEHIARVAPALVERIALDPARTAQQVPLAAGFRQRTALIEVAGSGQSQTLVSYAHALDLRLAPASGQLMVAHAGDGKPIPAAYVKVYAELNDGSVVFRKDGYTDMRGRFDYITVTGGGTDAIKRLALLIDADAFGSTVREVRPPTR